MTLKPYSLFNRFDITAGNWEVRRKMETTETSEWDILDHPS